MIYLATHTEDVRICEGSPITAYATMEEARAAAVAMLADTGLQLVDIVPGHFGDCWFKTAGQSPDWEALEARSALAPFTRDQMNCQVPGQHPGGDRVWFSPAADVHVMLTAPEE